jgi:Putative zinc-finger
VTCDDVRLALSLRLDGELPDDVDPGELDRHLGGCPGCAAFERSAGRVRAGLRFEPVHDAPDVAPAVVATLAGRVLDTRRPGPTHQPRRVGAGGGRDRRRGGDGHAAPGTRHDRRRGVETRAAPRGPHDRRRRDETGAAPGERVRPRRSLLAVAACAALAGAAAGAAFVGIGREPRSPAAADVPARVVAAQSSITSLDAHFRLVERGVGTDAGRGTNARGGTDAVGATGAGAGERSRDGRLVYEAPESLALTVEGAAHGDDGADTGLIVDGERWWQATPRRCAAGPGAACPARETQWVRSVTGREPFSDQAPVPLELVSPVDSFTLAATPAGLGSRTIAGRRAIGVVVTAAQVAPFLDGLSPAGLRPVHPGDPVEVWLDDDHLVPLEVIVRAGDDPDRARWAHDHGATERPGDVVVSFTVGSVAINGPVDAGAFRPPHGSKVDERVDAGFRAAGGMAAPRPAALPAGFRAHRSGVVTVPGAPTVSVGSYTDGRAWLTVRATGDWPGGRLFGGLGASVRAVDLGGGGVGYVSDDGRQVALHGEGIDVVVSGSLPAGELREVAASLGVTGQPVPPSWDEAATATVAEAAAASGRLLVAREIDGFGAPAVRITGDTVSQVYAGPGDRGFTLVQSGADQLAPPADGDVAGVAVRGADGRYSHERGQLEWIEAGASHSLSSHTLSLAELLAIADGLAPA